MRRGTLTALGLVLALGLAGWAEAQSCDGCKIGYSAPGGGSYTATLGAELAPALEAANWTCGAGWDCSVAGVLDKNADGVGTAVPNPAITAVVGTTYEIRFTVGALTVASGATYTFGGTPGEAAISDVGSYVHHVTASTTASLIITPTPTGTRFTITAVSVKALADTTGDLTVAGDLVVDSGSTFKGQLVLPAGTITQPSATFAGAGTGGAFYNASSAMKVITGFHLVAGTGSIQMAVSSTGSTGLRLASDMIMGWTPGAAASAAADAFFSREAAATIQTGADAATATAQTLKAADSTGANVTGASMTLKGGAGTSGNAAGGALILQGGVNAGSGEPGAVAIADGGTKPTCAAGIRGSIWYDAGGAGVADTFEVCAKQAAGDSYSWRVLATIP